jgi:hypothetical protein
MSIAAWLSLAGIVLVLAACSAAASGALGAGAFLKRWLLCSVAIAALLAAGAVLGMVAHSAMCAGPWICEVERPARP